MALRLAVFDLVGTLKQARNPYLYLHERLGTLGQFEGFLKGLDCLIHVTDVDDAG